jgi:hypothetical protein
MISGRLKRNKYKTELISDMPGRDRVDIEYTGGVVNLTKTSCNYNSKGQLEEITAPFSMPIEKLKKIAKHKGAENIVIKQELITERYGGIEKNCFEVDTTLIRAILCDILELAHYGYIKNMFPNVAKHHCLDDMRFWIRTGLPTNRFPPRDICFAFAPISDILDRLFEPSTFSHRLVVSYDCESNVLILVAQFVNTMPWVFVIENIVASPRHGSILYKKALLDGKDQLWASKCAVFDMRDIKWKRFCVNTRYSREFAQTKWLQEIETQRARAHYEYDLRIDDYIKLKLTYYINQSSSKTTTPEIEAIVKRMQELYQESQQLKDILEITRRKSLEIWDSIHFPGSQRDQKVLFVYRECLKNIKSAFGYPTVYVDLP